MASLNSKLDLLLKPIIIEIISWLDQDSLMNLSLVSKQLYNIIRNEPGNKNKIIPVFEVNGSSTLTFFQNLNEYFLNTETKNKLQSYNIMRFKDVNKTFDSRRGALNIVLENNVQMNGITTLYLSSPSIATIWTGCDYLLLNLPKFLPNLLELVISNVSVPYVFIRLFTRYCPLLEKVTLTRYLANLDLCGFDMQNSKNLKEINMDNVNFILYYLDDKDKMADLKNHQEKFIFHRCCKNLERVSIRNINVEDGNVDDNVDEDQNLNSTQNLLIKFVLNAPPSLRWFRSDLTQKNITMLIEERPGIELLN